MSYDVQKQLGIRQIIRQEKKTDGLTSASTVPLALGFEVNRIQKIDDENHIWQERVLVIYSPSLARTYRQALTARLHRAEKELYTH